MSRPVDVLESYLEGVWDEVFQTGLDPHGACHGCPHHRWASERDPGEPGLAGGMAPRPPEDRRHCELMDEGSGRYYECPGIQRALSDALGKTRVREAA